MTTPKPQFVLHLEAMPKADGSDPSGMYRLKGALKHLLRAWGLRCKRIEYPQCAEPTPPESQGTSLKR
jgi:hypothetical protein